MDIANTSIRELQCILHKKTSIPIKQLKGIYNSLYKPYKSSPQSYYSSSQIAKVLLVNSIIPASNVSENTAEKAIIVLSNCICEQIAPYYWLNGDLVKDFILTSIPSSIPNRITLPDLGLIVLPKNEIITETGNVMYICYKIVKPSEDINLTFATTKTPNKIQSVKVDLGCFGNSHFKLIWSACEDTGYFTAGFLSFKSLNDELELVTNGIDYIFYPKSKDEQQASQLLSILINCLIYANPINTDLTKERKGIGFSRASTKLLYDPLWIGKGYKRTNQKVSNNHFRASPRMHWRRGHYRRIACGADRKQRIWHWIKPTLVRSK